MRTSVFAIAFFSFIWLSTGNTQALADSRPDLIAQALDCFVTNSSQLGPMIWDEVCATSPSSLAEDSSVREEMIEKALIGAQGMQSMAPAMTNPPLNPQLIESSVFEETPGSPAAENVSSGQKSMAVVMDEEGNVSAGGVSRPMSSKSMAVTMDEKGKVSAMREELEKTDRESRQVVLNDDVAAQILEDDGNISARAKGEAQRIDRSLDKAIVSGEKKASDRWWPILERNNPRHKWEFGTEAFSYSYSEPDFAELEGYMFGAFLNYDYRWRINRPVQSLKDIINADNLANLFRFEGRLSYGSLDYYSYGTGEDDGIPNWSYEVRGLLGYDIPFADVYQLTPYAGIGFRYLLDDQGGRRTTTGHYGYDRESQYTYLPIGFDFSRKLGRSWACRLNLEWDVFLDGEQVSHNEDVDPSLSPVHNDQNSGYGYRGSLRVTKETSAIDYFVEPYFRYWKIDDSEFTPLVSLGDGWYWGIVEPENKTTEWGVKVGVRY